MSASTRVQSQLLTYPALDGEMLLGREETHHAACNNDNKKTDDHRMNQQIKHRHPRNTKPTALELR